MMDRTDPKSLVMLFRFELEHFHFSRSALDEHRMFGLLSGQQALIKPAKR